MPTPLEEHVSRNLEPGTIARIESEIAAQGVEFIYYQCISINGRVLAKVVPAKHLRRNLEKGVQFHGSAVSDLTSDRNGNLMGGGGSVGACSLFQPAHHEPMYAFRRPTLLCDAKLGDVHLQPLAPLTHGFLVFSSTTCSCAASPCLR